MAYRRVRRYRRKRRARVVKRKRMYCRRTFRKTRFNRSILSYNPQYMRVKRKFDFLVPSADLSRGTYGAYALLSIAPSGTTNNAYGAAAYDFRVSDIPNVSEFGTLFDQYKITGVKLKFVYMTATQQDYPDAGSNPSSSQVTMLLWNDFDDITTPTASNAGWSAAQETGRVKAKVFPNVKNNTMSIFLRPKVLTAIVDSSGTTTGRGDLNPWLDGSTGLQAEYLGVKVLLQCPPCITTSPSHVFKCIATYYTVWRQRQ